MKATNNKQDNRYEMTEKTTFEEFLALMHKDRRTANFEEDVLKLIFERVSTLLLVSMNNADFEQLYEKVCRRNEDDKYQAERKQRRAIDDLRSYIKHLEPPVKLDDTYEKVRPRIERSDEYLALKDDDLRRSAFDKHMRRLKEKEEDAERERAKRREREGSRSLGYRDRRSSRDIRDPRDRGERHYRDNYRHSRSSRSPEPDAYEADRRKAIADREKNYRGKNNVADTLLSPRRRGSIDRSERDHYRKRHDDPMDRYPRASREREEDERERLYRRRGDPRGTIDELPYGDEKPAVSNVPRRRRADSDLESAAGKREIKVSSIDLIEA